VILDLPSAARRDHVGLDTMTQWMGPEVPGTNVDEERFTDLST